MTIPTLKSRCHIKTRYHGSNVCCALAYTAVIRHERGDAYKACTKHTRMAFDGLVGEDGVVLEQPKINRLKKDGKIPPSHCRWKTIDPH